MHHRWGWNLRSTALYVSQLTTTAHEEGMQTVTPQRWYTLRSTVLNWRNHTNGYNTAIVVWRSSTCRVTKQDKTRCLVTILQLYFGPKVSMTKHGVLWRFYTCVVVLKLVVSMTQHGILLRFYNYRVVIKLVW